MTHSPERTKWAEAVPFVLVAAACLFNLIGFAHELFVVGPDPNDHVLHFALIERSAAASSTGGSAWDPWIPYWGQGFPVMRYYQHLPHLLVVGLHSTLSGLLSLYDTFKLVNLIAITVLPLCIFGGARLLGLRRLAAAFAAVCSCLLATSPNISYAFGYQLSSFSWIGAGLFPQLLACCLLPLSLGALHRALSKGRGYALTIFLLSALWLSHLILGYFACLLGLLELVRSDLKGSRRASLLRVALMYVGVALATAYLLLPTLSDGPLLWHSQMENAVYWDSFGAASVLKSLFGGGLFDGDGPPVLTGAVVAGGLVVAVSAVTKSSQSSVRRYLLFAAVLAILGYFGRPTWGRALALVPFSENLPFHRFVVLVHLAGLLLAGVAIALVWELIGWRRSGRRIAVAALATLCLLAVPGARAWDSVSENRELHKASAEEWVAYGPPLTAAMASIRQAEAVRPGRCYGGTSWDWGRGFRTAQVPIYLLWGSKQLSAISYMLHTMGRSSETEPRFDPLRRDHYDLFNVRYLLVPTVGQLPSFATAFSVRPGLVAAAVETGGYFDVVDSDTFVDTSTATAEEIDQFHMAFIASDWHAAGQFPRVGWMAGDSATATERLITTDDLAAPASTPPTSAGYVRDSGRIGETYSARIEASRAATILFRMSFHPGWYAEVDGVESEVVMLAPSYLGVPVEEGEHEILIRYRPSSAAAYLRWLGPLIVVFTFVGEWRWRRHSNPNTTGTA